MMSSSEPTIQYLDHDHEETLPRVAVGMVVSGNHAKLPPLPSSLVYLLINAGKLTTLPSLPSSLIQLTCSSNKLNYLPPLPSSLKYLSVVDNNISYLPPLPDNLTTLKISHNPLRELPTLPATLSFLQCAYTKLQSLPKLPSTLSYLETDLIPKLPLPPKLTHIIVPTKEEDGKVSIDEFREIMKSAAKDKITTIVPYARELLYKPVTGLMYKRAKAHFLHATERCQALTAKGMQCKRAISGLTSKYCYIHMPRAGAGGTF